MSDNAQDPGLADAINSIRSVGEDWESTEPRPPASADAEVAANDSTPPENDDERNEEDHG